MLEYREYNGARIATVTGTDWCLLVWPDGTIRSLIDPGEGGTTQVATYRNGIEECRVWAGTREEMEAVIEANGFVWLDQA